MKGILGRKVGMTQVFSEFGQSIPVSVIEVQPNVVTSVFSKDKNGYTALQLAVEDKRDKVSTKPMLGHFKKANTNAKRFVKEIRGMEGFNLGDVVTGSIFKSGELVDVTGTSKGHGFQGTIKRHNQHIGPKSHGGGGGSQPLRQTGSLGDMVSNRVFKGMTMPGHMGVDQVTVQNLEIVLWDAKLNTLLVKGSIPGPRKGFVVIREAVKGLPSLEAVKLVDVKESIHKNKLLEEAKKWGTDVNTQMSVEEMEHAIETAKIAFEAEEKAKEAAIVVEELAKQEERIVEAKEAAEEEVKKAEASGDKEAIEEAQTKVENLTHQVEVIEEKEKEALKEAKEAEIEAKKAEAISEALQVETEEEAEVASEETKEGKGE